MREWHNQTYIDTKMAIKRPLIQIALAVYNGQRYLNHFLDSLLSQSFPDFQLIVSDNASTDCTLAILRSYVGRFPHGIKILPASTQTTSAALNFARVTDWVTAQYVMYADADDVWYPDKIRNTYATMIDAEKQYGRDVPLLVHTDLEVVDHELRQLSPSYWKYQNVDPKRTQLRHLLMRNCVTGCTCMLNHALVERIRPIPAEARMHDHWCAVTAAALGRIVTLPEQLIAYRQHGSNDTGASEWSINALLKRLLAHTSPRDFRRPIDSKILQAKALLARHGNEMNANSRAVVEALSSLSERNPLSRRLCVMRHGLFDTGFVRNVVLFLAL